MEVIFIGTGLNSSEEGHVRALCMDGDFVGIERTFPKIVTIVNDTLHVVYIIDKEIFHQRQKITDVTLNTFKLERFYNTRIIKNIRSDGTFFYTMGNLFGRDSVLLGHRFQKFMRTDKFKAMIGARMIVVILIDKDDNFVVEEVDCHCIGPMMKIGLDIVTPIMLNTSEEIERLRRMETELQGGNTTRVTPTKFNLDDIAHLLRLVREQSKDK